MTARFARLSTASRASACTASTLRSFTMLTFGRTAARRPTRRASARRWAAPIALSSEMRRARCSERHWGRRQRSGALSSDLPARATLTASSLLDATRSSNRTVSHDLLPEAERRRFSIFSVARTIPASWPREQCPARRYNYAPAPPPIMERVARIEAICRRHDVPLAAAAIQFPLGHPRIASIVPGAVAPAEVEANVALMQAQIPPSFGRIYATTDSRPRGSRAGGPAVIAVSCYASATRARWREQEFWRNSGAG